MESDVTHAGVPLVLLDIFMSGAPSSRPEHEPPDGKHPQDPRKGKIDELDGPMHRTDQIDQREHGDEVEKEKAKSEQSRDQDTGHIRKVAG